MRKLIALLFLTVSPLLAAEQYVYTDGAGNLYSRGGGVTNLITAGGGISTNDPHTWLGAQTYTNATTNLGPVVISNNLTVTGTIYGTATNATHAIAADTAGTATTAGSASTAGTATFAASAGYSTNAGTASYATNAGSASTATTAGSATTASYATNAGSATTAGSSTYAVSASLASNIVSGAALPAHSLAGLVTGAGQIITNLGKLYCTNLNMYGNQSITTETGTPLLYFSAKSSTASDRGDVRFYRNNGGTSTVSNGWYIGGYDFFAYDGSAYQGSAAMYAVCGGTVSVGSAPQSIIFATGNNSTPSTRFTIPSDGGVTIAAGTVFPAHVAGKLYYHSTSNKLYCSNGSTWNALW